MYYVHVQSFMCTLVILCIYMYYTVMYNKTRVCVNKNSYAPRARAFVNYFSTAMADAGAAVEVTDGQKLSKK